jgi:putative DNA primase/helicase
MVTADIIARALNGRKAGGQWICQCPAHEDRRPSLAVRDGDGGIVLVFCHAGCKQSDVIDALKARDLWDALERTGVPTKLMPKPAAANDNLGKARWLWQRSQPIQGTVAEIYLRRERGICCPLPQTLRFLPAGRQHPPSMIAAFGFPVEPEPGLLSLDANESPRCT